MNPIAAGALEGGRVVNVSGDPVGTIEDVMVDLVAGTIAFAVLAGGPEQRFAVPWQALKPDAARDCYVLDYAAAR